MFITLIRLGKEVRKWTLLRGGHSPKAVEINRFNRKLGCWYSEWVEI